MIKPLAAFWKCTTVAATMLPLAGCSDEPAVTTPVASASAPAAAATPSPVPAAPVFDAGGLLGKSVTEVELSIGKPSQFRNEIKPNTNEMAQAGGESRTYFPGDNAGMEVYYVNGKMTGVEMIGWRDVKDNFTRRDVAACLSRFGVTVAGSPTEIGEIHDRWLSGSPKVWVTYAPGNRVDRVRIWR